MDARNDRPAGDLSRRAFVIHLGAVASLLAGTRQLAAQAPPPPVAGKEKLLVRSPRPINLETPLRELTADVTPHELFFVRNKNVRGHSHLSRFPPPPPGTPAGASIAAPRA